MNKFELLESHEYIQMSKSIYPEVMDSSLESLEKAKI